MAHDAVLGPWNVLAQLIVFAVHHATYALAEASVGGRSTTRAQAATPGTDFVCVLPGNSTEYELRELQVRNCEKVRRALYEFHAAARERGVYADQAAAWARQASAASALCEESARAVRRGDLRAAASYAVNAWGGAVMRGAECCTFVSPPFCQDMTWSPSTLAIGGLAGVLALMLAGAAAASCLLPARREEAAAEAAEPPEEEAAPPPSGRPARPRGEALGAELEERWLGASCLRALPGARGLARSSAGLFGALQQAFDFQADSVRNQHEHLLSLWRSHCAAVADRAVGQGRRVDERGLLPEALAELHTELMEGFLDWRAALQRCKAAGVPDRGADLPPLGGAWWEPVSAIAVSEEASPTELTKQLAEVATYLLVWGEAGNIRFMPELIYFLTELALAAERPGHSGLYNIPGSVHVEAASPFHSGLFLAKVLRPIYNVVFDEWYEGVDVDAKTGRDRKKLRRGFDAFLPADVANYDDWNELFCDPERLVETLVLTDGRRLFDEPHEQRFAALARVDWPASLDGPRMKTHREVHSLWGVFASAHRVALLHAVLFFLGVCTVAGSPPGWIGREGVLLGGREAAVRFAAVGLLVPAHGLLWAFARWLTLGRAATGRDRRSYYLGGLCRCTASLVPLLTYLGVRYLELQGRSVRAMRADFACCLSAHYLVSILGLLYLLLTPARQFDRLWTMTAVPLHLRAVRYVFWFVALSVKFLLGLFIFKAVYQEVAGLEIVMLGHLPVADVSRAFGSTVWLSDMLECLMLWFTSFFLFVADTQLWFTICCMLLGVGVALAQRRFEVRQYMLEDAISKIPERFTRKVLYYLPGAAVPEGAEGQQGDAAASDFGVVWDRVVEYMRYEDKCDAPAARGLSFSPPGPRPATWARLSRPLRPGPGSLEDGDGDGDGACAGAGDGAGAGAGAGAEHRRTGPPALFAPRAAGCGRAEGREGPGGGEAQWRLLALARGLALPTPRPFRAPYVPGITVLIPHYGEAIVMAKGELYAGDEARSRRVPLIDWVNAHYGDELRAFFARQKAGPDGGRWPLPGSPWSAYTAEQWDVLCTWASMRMQTLWRTVAGVCLYHPALQCHYEMQADRLSCLARPDIWNPSDCFTCLVSMQMYKSFDEAQVRHTNKMLEKFPQSLKVAFIDSVDRNINAEADLMHRRQRRRYFSCLIDRTCPLLPDGRRVPKWRIELPGYPVLGDGKGDNQNHALPFARGAFAQCIDANQGGYFEQMLLLPCVLGEFRTSRRGDGGSKRIIGLPEHITSNIGSIGDFAASAEHAFGTILQRSYAVLGARMHYGHPDIMNKHVMMQQGGVSKATKTLNLSEDIFAGMDFTLRGGGRKIRHCEYFHLAKGRDLGFNTVLTFFAKLSSGAGEQILTRQMFRLGQLLHLPDFLTFFYAHVGYYITQFLMSWSMPVLVFTWLLVLAGDCEASFQAFENCPERSAMEVMAKTLSVWFSMMLMFFFVASCTPLLAEVWMERGLVSALAGLVRQFLTCSWLLFIFQAKIIGFYVMNELRYGGATYVSTGRGLPTERRPFIGKPSASGCRLEKVGGLYLDYAVHAFYDGALLLAGALLVLFLGGASEAGAYAGDLAWTWASIGLMVTSWLYAPFVFNPYQFRARDFAVDLRAWCGFFFEDHGRHWTEWYDRTQLKPRRGFRHSLIDINFFIVYLGLAAFFSAMNKKLRVMTSVYSAYPYVNLLHATMLVPPILGSLLYCILVLLVGKCMGCSKRMVGAKRAWVRKQARAKGSQEECAPGAGRHTASDCGTAPSLQSTSEGPEEQDSGEEEEEEFDEDDDDDEGLQHDSDAVGIGPDDRVAADYEVEQGDAHKEGDEEEPGCCSRGIPLAISAAVVVAFQMLEAVAALYTLHFLGWPRAFVAGIILKCILLQVILFLAEGVLQSRSFRTMRPLIATLSLWVHSNRMARDMLTSAFIFVSMAPLVLVNVLNDAISPQYNLHQLLIYRVAGHPQSMKSAPGDDTGDAESSYSADSEAVWSQCQAGHQCPSVPQLVAARGGCTLST